MDKIVFCEDCKFSRMRNLEGTPSNHEELVCLEILDHLYDYRRPRPCKDLRRCKPSCEKYIPKKKKRILWMNI